MEQVSNPHWSDINHPLFLPERKRREQKGYINYLPEQLNITGDVNTQELKRGLYEIIVYNSTLEITGTFSAKT